MRLVCLLLIVLPFTLFGAEEAGGDPNEWIIQSYRVPGLLAHGSSDLEPPPLPAKDANDEEIDTFIQASNQFITKRLEEDGFSFPIGSLMIYDPKSQSLAARLPRFLQDGLHVCSKGAVAETLNYIVYDLSILEGPPSIVRSTIAEANGARDHTAVLEKLESNSHVKVIQNGRLECQDGERARFFVGQHTISATEMSDSNQSMGEEVRRGVELELDSDLTQFKEALFLRFRLIHDGGGTGEHSGWECDSSRADLASRYLLKSGATQMLGVWTPTTIESGSPSTEFLRVAFVKANVVNKESFENPRLLSLLTERTDAFESGESRELRYQDRKQALPDGMAERSYYFPAMCFWSGQNQDDDPFSVRPSDAEFARNRDQLLSERSIQDWIAEKVGIPFPDGVHAFYVPWASVVRMRNTVGHHELMEAYLSVLGPGVIAEMAVEVYVVEAPDSVLHEMRDHTQARFDHSQQWEALMARNDVHVVNSSWLGAMSGNRGKLESVQVYRYRNEVEVDLDSNKSELIAKYDDMHAGFTLEFDPQLSADGSTINLNMAVHYDFALPDQIQQQAKSEGLDLSGALGTPLTLNRAEIIQQMIMTSGTMRMVSMWRPYGAPRFDENDTLQALFLRVTAVPQ